MTTTEIIQAIRNEIERQMNFYDGKEREVLDDPKQFTYALFYQGRQRMCAELLSFLSTLEVEEYVELSSSVDNYPKNVCPPSVECEKGMREIFEDSLIPSKSVELEDEIERYLHSIGLGYGGWVDGLEDEDLRKLARHFAQWGAEYRGSSGISNDLQSACDYANFEESHSLNAYIAFEEGFKKGVKWDREQMMKEAVDAIVEDWNTDPEPEITIPLNPEEFTSGDKVRVIILPKEDEK